MSLIKEEEEELFATKTEINTETKKQNYFKWLEVLNHAIQLNNKMNQFKWSKKTRQERFNQMYEPFEALYLTSQSMFWAALDGTLLNLDVVQLMIKCGDNFEKYCSEEEKLFQSQSVEIQNKIKLLK